MYLNLISIHTIARPPLTFALFSVYLESCERSNKTHVFIINYYHRQMYIVPAPGFTLAKIFLFFFFFFFFRHIFSRLVSSRGANTRPSPVTFHTSYANTTRLHFRTRPSSDEYTVRLLRIIICRWWMRE